MDVFVTVPLAISNNPKNPAYIYAHGGGGFAGTAIQHDLGISYVALNLNCTVFNVEYRLGPEVKCP